MFRFLYLLLLSGSVHANLELHRFDYNNFIVYADKNAASQVTSLGYFLETENDRLDTLFGKTVKKTITVYLSSSQQEFASLTQNAIPDWGDGCAIPAQSIMILKNFDTFGKISRLQEVALHELAHIKLYHTLRASSVPRWFDEGFALYESRAWRWGFGYRIAKAVLTSSLLSINDVERVLTFQESKAQLAYAECLAAMYYLVELQGVENVYNFITQVPSSDFSTAFTNVFALTPEAFNVMLEKHLKRKYSLIYIVGDESLLWMGIVALFILAYVLKKYRTKKVLDRWAREEENTPDVQ